MLGKMRVRTHHSIKALYAKGHNMTLETNMKIIIMTLVGHSSIKVTEFTEKYRVTIDLIASSRM